MLFGHGHALFISAGGDLPITITDAQGLADLVCDRERCAYPPAQVQVLTGPQATRNRILASLDHLARTTDSESTVLVSFAGHGYRVASTLGQASYLLPSGYDLDRLYQTAISGNEFTARLRAIPARQLVLLFDCCHAGDIGVARGIELTKAPFPAEMMQLLAESSGRVLIASSREDERVHAGVPYSAFTLAIIEALCGVGVAQRDGFVRVADLALHLRQAVPGRTNDRQHPVLHGEQADNFVVASYAGGASEPKGLPFPVEPQIEPAPGAWSGPAIGQIIGGTGASGSAGPTGNRPFISGGSPIILLSGRDNLRIGGNITQFGGDYVRGDKFSVGNVSGSGIAIGRGAQASVQQGNDRGAAPFNDASQPRPDDPNEGRVGGDLFYIEGDYFAGNKIVYIFHQTPDRVESTPAQRAASLTAYRRGLLAATHYISLVGIPLPRNQADVPLQLRIPLEQVYIRIQAVEQQQSEEVRKQERRAMLQGRGRGLLQGRGHDPFDTLRMMGEYFYRQGQVFATTNRPAPVEPLDALDRHHHLVILGAPGSGKSTLLRMLARHAASDPDGPVPILVRLRDYATYRATGDDTLYDFALNQAARGNAVLRDAIAQAPRKLWLVDALDEARDSKDEVIQQVKKLTGDRVLTSRPIGYPGTLPEPFQHFEVLPLVADDVDRFMHNWFHVLAEQRQVAADWVAERVAWLQQQLADRPRIRTLTRNPLLLTFLVILASDELEHDLPTQRAELYRRYIEELLNSWELQRRPHTAGQGQPDLQLGRLQGSEARRAALSGLYSTGWYLHLAYNDAMQDYHPTAQGIIAYLAPLLAAEWSLPPGAAETLAKDVLDFWREAGLLDSWRVEGMDYLAFRHLTFQEYTAAWGLKQAYSRDAQTAWEFVRPRLHHYAWREPLLLTSTMLGMQHVDALVDRLLKGVSRYERDLLRDLHLAVAVLGEEAPLPQQTVDRLLRRFHKLIRPRFRLLLLLKPYLLLAVIVIATYASITTGAWLWLLVGLGVVGVSLLGSPTLALHLILAVGVAVGVASVTTGFWMSLLVGAGVIVLYVMAVAAVHLAGFGRLLSFGFNTGISRTDAISQLAAGGRRVVPLLQSTLYETDEMQKHDVVKALGRIGEPAIVELQQALNDPNQKVRVIAAEALGQIGDPAALSALQQAIHDADKKVRATAARALGQIGDPAAIPALQHALHDRESDVQSRAAYSLGQLGLPAVPVLLDALHDDFGVRLSAVAALGEIGDSAAVPHLQDMLQDDLWARDYAITALGQIGDLGAVPDLQHALGDSDKRVRRAAAQALARIGDPVVVPDLQHALSDSDRKVRRAAVQALARIGDPAANPTLQRALGDSDRQVRRAAARALKRVGSGIATRGAMPASLFAGDQQVRGTAATILREAGYAAVVPVLQSALYSIFPKQNGTASALRQTAGAYIPALQAALQDPKPEVRQRAVAILGESGDPAAIPILQTALHDTHWQVRSRAIAALFEIGSPAAVEAAEAALRNASWLVRMTSFIEFIAARDEDMPSLQANLHHGNWYLRLYAIGMLVNSGDPAAIPALQAVLRDVRWFWFHPAAIIAINRVTVESTSDINEARRSMRRLERYGSPPEQTANRFAVLEVQANPGTDPLKYQPSVLTVPDHGSDNGGSSG